MNIINTMSTCVREARVTIGATAFALLAGPAIAGPEGGVVVSGAASIQNTAPGVTTIQQSTDRAVIDWRTFSIGRSETVNFQQPLSTSATLNRVTGGQQSIIDGALNANGHVFLINPSGVLFNSTARVDVGGLAVTTSQINNADFMAGRLNFTAAAAPGAGIDNAGTISVHDGGLAALVAPSVRNSGLISARLGRIALAAGDAFTLDLYGDQMINFAVPATGAGVRSVQQSGQLIADSGRVVLSTDAVAGVVSGVINMSGVVQARSAQQLPTGEILLSGDNTDVTVSGTLDASGAGGGGMVRVGGGFAGEEGPRASHTDFQSGALVDVSGTGSSNAGKVALWGADQLNAAGTVRARGGEAGGDGGFIEVSGKKDVRLTADIDAAATAGRSGTLLLDPTDITVQVLGGNNQNASTVSGAYLNTQLRQGLNVTLQADNSLTVNDTIDGRPLSGNAAKSGAVSLTAGNISLSKAVITNNADITVTATKGDINFNSADAYLISSTAASGIGNGNVTLSATGGNIKANDIVTLGKISLTATGVSPANGNVTLQKALNGLSAAGTSAGVTGIGDLSVIADGSITSAGAYSNGNVDLRGAAGISLNGASNVATLNAGGSIALTTPSDLMLNTSVLSRGGSITIGSVVTRARSLTMGAGTVLQATGSTTGGISLFTGSGGLSAQDLLAGTNGDVKIDSQGAATLGKGLFGLSGSTGIGSLTINAAGAVSTLGAQTANAISISTSVGSLTNSTNSLISTAGAITLKAPGTDGSIAINPVGSTPSVVNAAVDAAKDIILFTPGSVQIGGSLRSGGTISVGTGTGTGQRVASLTMARDTSVNPTLATALQATGGVSIYTGGGGVDAQDVIAGANGTVLIDSLGAVKLNKGLFGLSGSTGIGALNVNAGGDVSAVGALAMGTISLSSGGALSNAIDALKSTNGGITLVTTGSSLGITIGSVRKDTTSTANPLNAALDSSGDITITTAGAVTLAGSTSSGGALNVAATGTGGNVFTNGAKAKSITLSSTGTLQNGTASLYSTGGAISLTGNVISLSAITGSGGAVASVDSFGAVTLAGTASTTINSGVVARGGSIGLTGGALTLNAGANAGLDASGSVSIANIGSVALRNNSVIVARAGSISIGTGTGANQRVASLNMEDGTALQTVVSNAGNQNGGISIFAGTAGVDARDLIAGTGGTVMVDSKGNVNLGKGVFGFGGNKDGAGNPIGVGALTVNATGAVTALGAKAVNAIDITSGGSLHNANASFDSTNGPIKLTGGSISLDAITIPATGGSTALAADVDSGGSISVQSPGAVTLGSGMISHGGDINIGSSTQSVASLNVANGAVATGTALLSKSSAVAGGSGSINVYATGSITTGDVLTGSLGTITLAGNDVTVNGIVTDSGDQTIAGTPTVGGSTGVGGLFVNGRNSIVLHSTRVLGNAQNRNSSGQSLAVITGMPGVNGTNGGSVDLLGPIVSGGPVYIGQTAAFTPVDPDAASTYAQINLSNNITTAGQSVSLAGDVTLFKGITRWDIECALGFVCVSNHRVTVDTSLFSAYMGPLCSGMGDCPPDPKFLAYDLDPVTGIASLIPSYNSTVVANGKGCETGVFVCGGVGASEAVLRRLMGGLTASIDTTGGGLSLGGATVVIRGSVKSPRDVAPSNLIDIKNTLIGLRPYGTSGGAVAVLPNAVSRAISINAGSSIISIGGFLGTTAATDFLATSNESPYCTPSGVSVGVCSIGPFNAALSGAFSGSQLWIGSRLSIGQQFFADAGTAVANSYPVITASSGKPLIVSDVSIYNVALRREFFPMNFHEGTAYGAGTYNAAPAAGAFAAGGGTFSASSGAGGTGVGTASPALASSGIGGTTTLTGSSGSGVSTSDATSGGILSNPSLQTNLGVLPPSGSGPSEIPPSTIEYTDRRDTTPTSGNKDLTGSLVADNDKCPRGPAQLADLGRQPAVGGIAPDVFERCRTE